MTNWLTKTVEDVRASLAGYRRAGFDKVILHPMATVPAELERPLDRYERQLLDIGR
jgi:hypothetical protein